MRPHPVISMLLGLVLITGCPEEEPTDFEGDEPGECTDGADNDRDGDFDCEDDGCASAPDCVGDDDTADDDTADDDTGDDDTMPCNIPGTPSVVLEVTSGTLAGPHVISDTVICGPDPDGVGFAANFLVGNEYLLLKVLYETFPNAGYHDESQFRFWWDAPPNHAERLQGGVDCYIDFLTDYQQASGCFTCAGVTVTGPDPTHTTDVVDGAFLCQ
jgi:hypothetical protein